jgi:hypothetical protein
MNDILLEVNPHNYRDFDNKSFNMSENISKNISIDKTEINDL